MYTRVRDHEFTSMYIYPNYIYQSFKSTTLIRMTHTRCIVPSRNLYLSSMLIEAFKTSYDSPESYKIFVRIFISGKNLNRSNGGFKLFCTHACNMI